MPELQLSSGVNLFYHEDNFTDPWTTPEAIFLLHGFAENSESWRGWVPSLARHFRVIRPDMRGFGRSTPAPAEMDYTVELVNSDFMKLADHLGIKRFHVVGAKSAGAIAMRMATSYPDRVLTVTVTGGTFMSGVKKEGGVRSADAIEKFLRDGVGPWARETMTGRLGSDAPPEMLEYWIKMMSATPNTTAAAYGKKIPMTDVTGDLPRVQCPVQVIIIDKDRPGVMEATKERVKIIPHGEVTVISGDSYHVAATHPEECARLTMDFIERCAVKV